MSNPTLFFSWTFCFICGISSMSPLWIIKSRFDEVHIHRTTFAVLFPLLGTTAHVNVGNDILDVCATHNYVVVATREHIYIAHKDELQNPQRCSYERNRPLNFDFQPYSWSCVNTSNGKLISTKSWPSSKNTSDIILTSTVSTAYLVHTVDDVSTVVRLFNEYTYLERGILKPTVVQISEDVHIVMAASGNDHSLFLTNKGAVFALGTGSRGELGIGLIPRVCELTWLEALEGVHVNSIAAAGWHSAALTGDGDVYVWGWNHRGQLGDEKERVELYPLPLDIDLRVVRVELQEHLTALWVAEDKDEPSIVMGSDEIGMPPIRLKYYDQIPDKRSDDLPRGIDEDLQVDMVFLSGKKSKINSFKRCGTEGEHYEEFEYPIRDRD